MANPHSKLSDPDLSLLLLACSERMSPQTPIMSDLIKFLRSINHSVNNARAEFCSARLLSKSMCSLTPSSLWSDASHNAQVVSACADISPCC